MASNSNSTAATSINRGIVTTNANINPNTNNDSSTGIVANSSISIEDLYKYFGILADAKDQAGDVSDTNQ